jgi:hypothetical protein
VYYLLELKKAPVRKVTHEYFNRLWLWPPGSHTRWEAEVDVALHRADKKVGFHSESTHEEVAAEWPTDAEVAFCRRWMSDLDGLLAFTRPGVEEAWKDWFKQDLPESWQSALILDGFSVPKDGDINQPWGVMWFCEAAGHYFSIKVRDGRASLESIDGYHGEHDRSGRSCACHFRWVAGLNIA